jgi:D-arginine dehydrogenase
VTQRPRVAIIGGGIAGLSCGAAIADACDVTLLEAEAQPGYHSSGRSAAVCISPYMNPLVHALTLASRAWHVARGAQPIGDYTIADAANGDLLDAFLDEWRPLCPDLREVPAAELLKQVPILRRESSVRVVFDPESLALDVHGMLDHFRRRLIGGGGRVINGATVTRLERNPAGWRTGWETGAVDADIVVNAAGAWGDAIATLAGVRPLGLTPKRRTALLLDMGADVRGWPMVHRVQGGLYFKPEARQLMLSLGDATPSPPCDAQPEELDLATLAQRFEEATTHEIRRLGRSWAGLRSFLPDERPAVGFDPGTEGFFWLIGQGGFGVQTAPALSDIAGALLRGRDAPFAAELSPERFAEGQPPMEHSGRVG